MANVAAQALDGEPNWQPVWSLSQYVNKPGHKELQLAAAEAKVPEIQAKVAEARQQRKAAAEAAAAEAEAQAAAMEVGDFFMMVCP